VLALALPALAQQYLHLLVRLSDQYLADNFQRVPVLVVPAIGPQAKWWWLGSSPPVVATSWAS
jgi:hypothetical protein